MIGSSNDLCSSTLFRACFFDAESIESSMKHWVAAEKRLGWSVLCEVDIDIALDICVCEALWIVRLNSDPRGSKFGESEITWSRRNVI